MIREASRGVMPKRLGLGFGMDGWVVFEEQVYQLAVLKQSVR